MFPLPPCKVLQSICNFFRKSPLYQFSRNTRNNRIGCHILCDDGARRDNRSVTDCLTGQDNRAMADPDIVADGDRRRTAPFKEIGIVGLTLKLGA